MRFLRHDGIYRSDGSSLLFTPGACPAFRSGRCQGIEHAGKNAPSPSSAMSSGRLFLDRVGRHQSPSPLHRHHQNKAMAFRRANNYHRTAGCVLTVCVSRGDKRMMPPETIGRHRAADFDHGHEQNQRAQACPDHLSGLCVAVHFGQHIAQKRRQGKHDQPAREGERTHPNDFAVKHIRDQQRRRKQARQHRQKGESRLLRSCKPYKNSWPYSPSRRSLLARAVSG
jgi:hypothetical protein